MDTTTTFGQVRDAVRQMNARAAGASAGDRLSTHARHGNAEQSSRPRARSRERGRSAIRTNPAGPQEQMDWLQALEVVHDRLDTIDRLQRLQAQSMATMAEDNVKETARLNQTVEDIGQYKKFVSDTHRNLDDVLLDKLKGLQGQIDSITSILPPSVESIDARVREIEEAFRRAMSENRWPPAPPPGMEQPGPSQGTHHLGTPQEREYPHQCPPQGQAAEGVHAQAAHPAAYDPWYEAAQKLRSNDTQLPTAAQPTAAPPAPSPMAYGQAPLHSHPQGPTRVPGVPGSFAEYCQAAPPGPAAGHGHQEFAGTMPVHPPGYSGSPFDGGAQPGYRTPDNRPGGAYGCHVPYNAGAPMTHPGISAWAGGRSCIFEVSRKLNPLLFTFTSNVSDFQLWCDRMVDHLCRATQRWRFLMDYASKCRVPFTKQWLLETNVDGINAWDLSTILEAFLVDWFPKAMYRRRVPLAGGEHGNGLEMWRRLHNEYKGDDDAIEFGGVRRLQEFARCNDLKLLPSHLDDWLEVLSTYGSELEHCPKLLRSMVFSIIPKTFEDDLLTKPEFTRSYHDIIKWCRQKCQILRTRELADFTRKPTGTSSHAKTLRTRLPQMKGGGAPELSDEDPPPVEEEIPEEEVPAWAKGLLAAIKTSRVPPPPRPTGEPRKKSGNAKQRAVIPSGFKFIGCWHCKSPDHSRSGGRDGKGAKCPLFAKLLRDSNPGVTDRKKMKLPANYQGAYEKALIAAGGKPRRINALDGDDHESDEEDFNEPITPGGMCRALLDEDDSDSDSESDVPGRCAALTNPPDVPVALNQDEPKTPPYVWPSGSTSWLEHNTFEIQKSHEHCKMMAALKKSERDEDEYRQLAAGPPSRMNAEMIDALNGWATKVSRKSRRTGKTSVIPRDNSKTFVIHSEKQLDQYLENHPSTTPLPTEARKIRKVLRTRPVQLECKPGEVLCLVDSGSTVNAACIAKHFPSYAEMVRSTKKSRAGDFATTACGKQLANRGRCAINSTVDDEPFPVAFKDMDVELPILSVRKMVKRNHAVSFDEGGGTLYNKVTKKTLHFYEYEGVYFIKLKVSGPDEDIGQLFARPGTP